VTEPTGKRSDQRRTVVEKSVLIKNEVDKKKKKNQWSIGYNSYLFLPWISWVREQIVLSLLDAFFSFWPVFVIWLHKPAHTGSIK